MMYGRELDCLGEQAGPEALPVHAVRQEDLEGWLGGLPQAQAAFVRASGFAGKAGKLCLLPGPDGLAGAVLGLGSDASGVEAGPHAYGGLAGALPRGSLWRMGEGIADPGSCVLGFCLGAYRYPAQKAGDAPEPGARICLTAAQSANPAIIRSLSAARAIWLARDLINTPANLLGPAELASAAESILTRNGAHVNVIGDASVAEMYPALYAVGRGSARAPVVVIGTWRALEPRRMRLVFHCVAKACASTQAVTI